MAASHKKAAELKDKYDEVAAVLPSLSMNAVSLKQTSLNMSAVRRSCAVKYGKTEEKNALSASI